MRLLHFSAGDIFNQMKIAIDFNRNITFITGINGSGKTTSLRIIMALLQPNIGYLVSIDLASARLSFSLNQKEHWIDLKKYDKDIIISSDATVAKMQIPIIKRDLFEPNSRYYERYGQFLSEIEAKNATNPLREFIGSLPTPMFLGLERRIDQLNVDENLRKLRYVRPRGPLAGPLHESVTAARDIAERYYRRVQSKQREAANKLRRDLILSSFDTADDAARKIAFRIPNRETIPRLKNDYDLLRRYLPVIGIAASDIEATIGEYVQRLEQITSDVLKAEVKNFSAGVRDERTRDIMMKWYASQADRSNLDRTLKFVQNYAREEDDIMNRVNTYLRVLNSFLTDSGKYVGFTSEGDLQVQGNDDHRMSVSDLSSGESHVFVIFTHLFFFEEEKGLDVLVIDEPELSLHIRWQEIFVDSIISAAAEMQVILATHSPSIIMDRLDSCVEI